MEEEVKAANGAPAKENKNTSDEKDTKDEAEDAEGEKQEIPFPFERLWALVLAPVGFGDGAAERVKHRDELASRPTHDELAAWLINVHRTLVSGP